MVLARLLCSEQNIFLLSPLFNPHPKTVAVLHTSTTSKAGSKCGLQIENSRPSPVSTGNTDESFKGSDLHPSERSYTFSFHQIFQNLYIGNHDTAAFQPDSPFFFHSFE